MVEDKMEKVEEENEGAVTRRSQGNHQQTSPVPAPKPSAGPSATRSHAEPPPAPAKVAPTLPGSQDTSRPGPTSWCLIAVHVSLRRACRLFESQTTSPMGNGSESVPGKQALWYLYRQPPAKLQHYPACPTCSQVPSTHGPTPPDRPLPTPISHHTVNGGPVKVISATKMNKQSVS
ncbi:unnamed protein product [Gadus morhua 'NCC']